MIKRLVIIIVCIVVGSMLAMAGHSLGLRTAYKDADANEVRNQKILDVIVRRNPQASVRDFQNFPAQFVREAESLKLDFRYVMALIDAESEWNPNAVSPKCAIGLMQVMPKTALDVVTRYKLDSDERPYIIPVGAKTKCYESIGSLGDPMWNIRVGMRYLRAQIDEYGFGPEHLRAYNRGPGLARANWPSDRYAETVAFKYVALAQGALR